MVKKINIKKTKFYFLFFIFFIVSCETSKKVPELYKEAEPSVVMIVGIDEYGNILKIGTGFFISRNGYLLTNRHVVENTYAIGIKTKDNEIKEVKIIDISDKADLALLKVNNYKKFRHLQISKAVPRVGEQVIVISNPQGLERSLSEGVISAERDDKFGVGKVYQMTAPISPGSSGGPVLNMNGKVVGIATGGFSDGQNINFAITLDEIIEFIKENKIRY